MNKNKLIKGNLYRTHYYWSSNDIEESDFFPGSVENCENWIPIPQNEPIIFLARIKKEKCYKVIYKGQVGHVDDGARMIEVKRNG